MARLQASQANAPQLQSENQQTKIEIHKIIREIVDSSALDKSPLDPEWCWILSSSAEINFLQANYDELWNKHVKSSCEITSDLYAKMVQRHDDLRRLYEWTQNSCAELQDLLHTLTRQLTDPSGVRSLVVCCHKRSNHKHSTRSSPFSQVSRYSLLGPVLHVALMFSIGQTSGCWATNCTYFSSLLSASKANFLLIYRQILDVLRGGDRAPSRASQPVLGKRPMQAASMHWNDSTDRLNERYFEQRIPPAGNVISTNVHPGVSASSSHPPKRRKVSHPAKTDQRPQ